jgi:hypothetical protein
MATILGLQVRSLEALISLIGETGLKPQPTDLEWVIEGFLDVIKHYASILEALQYLDY